MPRDRRTLTLCLISVLLISLCLIYSPAHAARQPGEPQIGAKAAIVVEYPSGKILYSKAMHARLAPASTTKIMTALLALEEGNLDDVVTVAQSDLTRGSSMGLKNGERQTLRDLLYGLMLPSGNDAATTIARYVATKSAGPQADPKASARTFVGMMNAQVAKYNLKDTNFANPHGLDRPNHYSSAYDLASLTWYAFQYPLFNKIVRQSVYSAPGHDLKNINKMIGQYSGADGVKTGYTGRAGLCLVSSATRNGKRLIAVVLNAPRWVEDSTALLDYGFARLAADPKATGLQRLPVGKQSAVGSWQ